MLTSQNFGRKVNGVAFHPTKNVLASCSNDKSIKLWNTDTGAELSTLKVDYAVDCLTYAPNGDVLAVGDRGGNINFFNSQGEKLQSPVRGEKPIQCLAFSRNGRILAAGDGWVPGGKDYSIRFYDAESGTQIGCPLNVGYAFSRCSTRISLPARPLFSRFSTRISV